MRYKLDVTSFEVGVLWSLANRYASEVPQDLWVKLERLSEEVQQKESRTAGKVE